jgi:hypothetical protein
MTSEYRSALSGSLRRLHPTRASRTADARVAAAAVLVLVTSSAPARAAEPVSGPPPDPTSAPPANVPAALLKPSPKRVLPDYDGRGKPRATVGEDLLVIPRVILSPLYFTTEYIIRRPLGTAIAAAERSDIPRELYDFFLFGPDHKAGVVPTLFFDFGFSPSVGLYGFWDGAGFKQNDINAHFSIWTSDWIAGSVGDTVHFGSKNTFTVKVAALRRPDRTFFGLGPNSLQGDLGRYGETRLDASATFEIPLWHSSELTAGSGVRSVHLYNGDYEGEPTVSGQSATGLYPLPPGYGHTYSEEFNHALLALDTRKASAGTGVRLEAQGEQGSDFNSKPYSAWVRYQGTAGVFVDVNGRGRVLSLTGAALFADPLENGGAIPFTEQIALGGNTPVLGEMATGTGLMPGLYAGRLVDRSAAVATLQYRWPIWAWLDGTLQVATGNVFGEHLSEFRPGLLRLSSAIGIASTGVSDNAFHLLIGIGSETFDHGGQIDSVRLAFGTSRF